MRSGKSRKAWALAIAKDFKEPAPAQSNGIYHRSTPTYSHPIQSGGVDLIMKDTTETAP